MAIDEGRLKQIYKTWKTEDLLKAITVDKTKYESFAINLMNREIQKRDVSKEEILKFHKNLLEKEEILSVAGVPFCPYCHSTNLKEAWSLWGFRDYFERSILGKLFSISIPRYECLECGYNFSRSREDR